MTTATRAPTVLDIVALACLAPSVHNTQPWSWRVAGSTLELLADPRRQLSAVDPQAHHLVISCGAALHHAQVAAHGLGWQTVVTRQPDDDDRDLLARIELTTAHRTPEHVAALETLHRRRTDRRRFTAWPVPPETLAQLATRSYEWG